MSRRPVPHEITFLAFGEVNGERILYDIVETSHHFAPHFARSFLRDPMIVGILAFPAIGPRPDDVRDVRALNRWNKVRPALTRAQKLAEGRRHRKAEIAHA